MYIKSTTGILQYKLLPNRDVILIGEYHDSEWSCSKSPEMTIFEFCNERLKANPKAVVLLEYNDSKISVNERKKYGSKIIRDVYTISGGNFVRGRDIGVDIRLDHLTMDNQQELYHGTKAFSPANLVSMYNPTKTNLDHSVCGDYEPMLDEYKINLDAEFESIKGDCDVVDLQWAWSKFMDYRVLWEITRTDTDYTEVISVFGENHRKNIKNVMDEWQVKKIQDSNKCEFVKM